MHRHTTTGWLPGIALVLLATLTTVPDAAAGGDAVTVWNANAGVAATAACIAPIDNPLHESRIYAMMHVAIHDALNAIDRRSRPYAFDRRAQPGASPEAAVAAAARDVLVPLIAQLPLELVTQDCIDAGVASVEAAYTAALAAIPGGRGGGGRAMIRPRHRVSPWDRPPLPRSST